MGNIPDIRVFLLVLALAGGCADGTVTVEVPFEVRFDGRPLVCSDVSGAPGLSDMRFFVHDVVLIRADGSHASLDLTPDGRWQSRRVALIDLEDGRGGCINGSSETNGMLKGRIAAGHFNAISFRVGVPEDLNHADPVVAEAPLSYTSMHWHWRSGYKFLRAGLVSDAEHSWLHLGSNRCSGTIGEIEGCAGANRVEVRLQDFVPGQHRVTVDLSVLFGGVDLDDGVGTDCSSGPAEETCAGPFAALDIDPRTGVSGGATRVFHTTRRQ